VLDTFKTKIPKNVKILENYQTFGNLVSTSIPNLICENFQKFQESKNIILSGFGVGLAHSSIVLKRS
jgi:3-oxoacyl-[acyl-carrier-protein] synthase III